MTLLRPSLAVVAVVALACGAERVSAGAASMLFADGFESLPACTIAAGAPVPSQQPQLLVSLEDSFHESWLASPAVADLGGDGVPEILVARSNGVLGFHIDGSVAFRGTVSGNRIWASPLVAELVASSPGLEVAAAARERIYAWNASGALLPGFPVVVRDELRSLAAGDIDGNGDLELVAVTTSPLQANGQRDILFAFHHDGSAVSGFPPNTGGAAGCTTTCFVTGGYDQNVALGDVDADAALEVFAGQDNAYLSLHDGDGRAFDAAPTFIGRDKFSGVRFLHDYVRAQLGFSANETVDDQAHFTNSAPAFADVDGDGLRELIIVGSVQNAAQTDRHRGVALWAVKPDGSRPLAWLAPHHVPGYLAGLDDFDGTNIVGATNQVAVAELDAARARREFVFAGFDGRIHAVDSARNPMWSHTYTTDARVLTGGVAVGDLSADGRPEIVFASYSPDAGKGSLFVLDALGNRLHTLALPERGAMSVPTLADADGDGTLDIVVNLKDGVNGLRQALVYRVPGAQPNCLPWPTGRGNLLRNGFVP